MNSIESLIDVREIPPRHRHPTIFKTWNELPTGGTILLINDHDPLPLYYQFAAEDGGNFHWEYLESGPTVWRVRISKGEFSHPGFVPGKKSAPRLEPIQFVEPAVLDTRPIFASGGSPCGAIDRAVDNLIPGQTFILLVPFEPAPLYAKLANRGFGHKAAQLTDGSWRVEFQRV